MKLHPFVTEKVTAQAPTVPTMVEGKKGLEYGCWHLASSDLAQHHRIETPLLKPTAIILTHPLSWVLHGHLVTQTLPVKSRGLHRLRGVLYSSLIWQRGEEEADFTHNPGKKRKKEEVGVS